MSVVVTPDKFTAAWWKEQYIASCQQNNHLVASMKAMEDVIAGAHKRIDALTTETSAELKTHAAKIGELTEILDKSRKAYAEIGKRITAVEETKKPAVTKPAEPKPVTKPKGT
jgi:hypothetical protein